MDIGSAFTYMFDDEDWIKKIAIGGGLIFVGGILSSVLIGIVLFLPVYGYMLATLKNVRDGHTRPLPEWSNFGDFFSKGLMVVAISFIYNLPAIFFACAFGAVAAGVSEMNSDLMEAMQIVTMCLWCVVTILIVIANALIPAALIRYAQYDTLGSAFQLGAIFNFVRDNISDYIIVLILALVAGMISQFGVILCLVGVFFTAFWSRLVMANLYGQLARRGV